MKSEPQIPRDRPFPPGRLGARRKHLLAEVRGDSSRSRTWSWMPDRRPRLLVAALAASAAAVLVAAVAVHELGRDSGKNGGAIHVVVASSGPVRVWNGIALTGPCGTDALYDPCGAAGPPPTFSIDVPRAVGRGAAGGVELVGGTAAERRTLRQIVEKLPESSLTRVEIVPVTSAGENRVTLRFAAAGGDPLRIDWQEMLVAGAYRDLARAENLRALVGFPPPSPVRRPAVDTAKVQARLRSAVVAAGATVDKIAVGEPNGLAVLLILRVSDPAMFLKHGLPGVLDSFGDRWRDYDGTFVEVVDHDGAFVWAAGTAPRTSHGSVGTRAGLEGCSPIVNWGPTPPPCRAG